MTIMSQLSRRAFLAASSAAVAAPVFAADAPKRGGTLVATWGGGEPQALFVPGGGGSSPYLTSTKMLERLLRLETDLSFTPVLATKVEAAADGKSYIITVRDGVTWHDGEKFTADDLAFTIENYWKPISGGLALKSLTGAKALDEHRVEVIFSQPMPEFSFKFFMTGDVVLPKHVYAGSDIRTNPANNKVVGTGPWKLNEWVRGSHVEYVRNDAYWRPGEPYLDRLVIRWWGEPAARSAAFEAGELHLGFYNPVPIADMRRLVRVKKIGVEQGSFAEATATTSLEFNQRNPILAKREVRQALMHAVDKRFIADTVYYGNARPADSAVATTNKLYYTKEVPHYEFDPKKAAALLDAAGYPVSGGKRFAMNLLSPGWFADNAKTGAYLKQAFSDVGLEVNLTVPDRPTSIKRLYTDYDYDIAVSNQAMPVEPVPLITQYFTTDGILKGAPFRNANGYSNPEMDALVAQMAVEMDAAKRKEQVEKFQKLVMTDVPLVQLVEIVSNTIMLANVRNNGSAPLQFADTLGSLSFA
jgi:peptide/nickel transport system substrate-binding protein